MDKKQNRIEFKSLKFIHSKINTPSQDVFQQLAGILVITFLLKVSTNFSFSLDKVS